ncbi:type 2 lantipeptide synthetase LanM family protein [Actinospica sp. MGRD01-02]|uniref:Type 2 lantipeptide synthetase LanM family protein n=1 Tax=Actinospica acidithermotolerans TaxID=2828514 RepID=A0A941EAJ6_9ACTN|nr:type 2 lanthipeptide synthetase LanM family protein [Actinospica acidithermotolerans]MBR7826938.1 type 2 lantipeptide synthetase LanM family protein [Actinospica acidithermotolerans]
MIETSAGPSDRAETHAWWLRALSPAEARDAAGTPEWAAFAAAAVAKAPVAVRPPEGELPGTSGFAAILAPFADLAAERVRAAAAALDGEVDLTAILDEFAQRLAAVLGRLAARTLVLELNVARVTGRLAGDSPTDRFRAFVGHAASHDGLASLLGEYAVLGRILAQAGLHAAEALAEVLHRLSADRPSLVATLFSGRDPGPLVEVRTSVGDGHRRGRSVALLRFADGSRLVYKPRSLAAHGHFNDLLAWFNARTAGPALRAAAVVEGDGYGWAEFVPHRPCRGRSEFERFYERQGALLALMYALDGTDMHFENVIACGDEPVLVDLETLFHPPAPSLAAQTAPDPAWRALESSVDRVGLLPRLLLGEENALDLSGLGGDAGQHWPVDSVSWADAGTDEMRLIRGTHAFEPSLNRPYLAAGDGAAEPADFTEALVAGFRAAYDTVVAGRDELVGPRGLLHRFARDEVRVVLRATHVYATLLEESTHPDVLRTAADRDGILESLRENPLGGPRGALLEDCEQADLRIGDVPLFTACPGAVDLCGAAGTRIPGALAQTGLDRVQDKIAAMGVADRHDQEWVIRASLAARCGTRPAAAPAVRAAAAIAAATAPDPETLLTTARALGDQLIASAFSDGERTNWVGLEPVGAGHWRVRAMGADLAHGCCGPALFLAQLAALTGSERYARIARLALAPVPSVLEALAGQPEDLAVVGSGAFAGLGGIAYALAQVAAALQDAEIGGWVERAVLLTAAAAEAEDEVGVGDGTAGGLAALLAVHQGTGSPAAWDGARACAARLLGRPVPAEPGFIRGAAGVGWALSKFAAAAGDPAVQNAASAMLRAADAAGSDSSWCEGLAGYASALAAADGSGLAAQAAAALRALALAGPLPDDSLCHGELGAVHALSRAADPELRAAAAERAAALAEALAVRPPRCGTPAGMPTPGLLAGLAGIGHGLLRIGFPDRIPSALLVEPPIPIRRPSQASYTR